jgi:DNA invertase Pin-like site-specific DNA recombinase
MEYVKEPLSKTLIIRSRLLNFKDLPKDQLIKLSKKGGRTYASDETKKAWEHQNLIKRAYEDGISTKQIAIIYKINRRQVYRIINDTEVM